MQAIASVLRACCLVLPALLCACGDAPAPKPDVIVIVVDTLRADRLSAYGYERPTSPFMQQLAAEGALFEDVTTQFSWTMPSMVSLFSGRYLTEFMPVVPLLGGNAGNQTLTVMVRGIALGEISWANSRKALVKEVLVGLMNGLAIGALVGIVAFLWKGDVILGAILSLAMLGTLLVAAVTGTLVPLFLRWLKVDPALASSVFVTTSTDVVGFVLFLGLGAQLLARFQ